jgi:hypothetical protein
MKYEIQLTFALMDFAQSRELKWWVAVDRTDRHDRYKMIIGQDLHQAIGMDILFSTQKTRWDGIEIPMQTTISKLIDLDKEIAKTKRS